MVVHREDRFKANSISNLDSSISNLNLVMDVVISQYLSSTHSYLHSLPSRFIFCHRLPFLFNSYLILPFHTQHSHSIPVYLKFCFAVYQSWHDQYLFETRMELVKETNDLLLQDIEHEKKVLFYFNDIIEINEMDHQINKISINSLIITNRLNKALQQWKNKRNGL